MPKEGIYKRADSPYWWAGYVNGEGKRVRVSTRIRTDSGRAGEQEARALLGKWEKEAHEVRMWGKTPEQTEPSYTFDDVMIEYFRERVTKQRAGLNRAKSTAKPLYLAFAGRAFSSISEADIKCFIRNQQAAGKSPATINKSLVMLSAACNYARQELLSLIHI